MLPKVIFYLKRHCDVIFIFVCATVFSSVNLIYPCKLYTFPSFDNQSLLIWDYSSMINIFPYREIFYPYGILDYFKSQNIFFAYLYLLLTPVIFSVIFLGIKKLFKNKIYSYLSLFIFFFFVISIEGLETFNRYGIMAASPFLFSYLFFSVKKHFYKLIFFIGVCTAVIFSFINDQGLYMLVIFIGFSLMDKFFKKKIIRSPIHFFLKEISFYFAGFCIGVVPYTVYLVFHGSFFQFLMYLKDLPELSLLSKTPFIHSIFSPDNIFSLLILFIAIVYLVNKVLIKNQKATFTTYIQSGFIFILIILEQKNIVRSMSQQMIFITLLLTNALLADLLFYFKEVNRYKITFLFCFIFIQLSIFLTFSFEIPKNTFLNTTSNSNYCIQQNMNNLISEDSDYKKVKNYLNSKKLKSNIYSYPGDQAFYILFNQIPPYSPSIYEGSPLRSQYDLIKYIQNNDVEYVIYNYQNTAIQDGVPNYIRVPYLHEYIMKNFIFEKKIGKFLILHRTKTKSDPLKDEFSKFPIVFKNYLQTVYLGAIPKSEGYYKTEYLNNSFNKVLITTASLKVFNQNLKNKNVDTHKKFLVLTLSDFRKNINTIMLKIKTKDGITTNVIFNECMKEMPCIINLSHIPLLYNKRTLEEISVNDVPLKSVQLFTVNDDSHFW
jgi:hypothetical protein